MFLKLNTKPTPREIRSFGWTILIGFSLIAAILFWRGRIQASYWMWSVTIPIGLLALVLPSAAWIFYVLWMGFAVIMGSIMSRIIMTLIYFCVVTPVSIIFRLTGRDALAVKKDTSQASYWVAHKQNMDRRFYQRLF